MKRIAVALLALLGLAAVLAGVGLRTIWLPPETVTAGLTVQDPSPYIITAPGVLEMYPGTASVTVEGDADTPVFVARGREQDVTAWAKNARVDTIIGMAGPGALALRAGTGDEPLPDPRTADIWLDSASQTGEANYVWREAPGRYQLVVATDGQEPAPSRIIITWPDATQPSPWAVPLIVIGATLLVGALAIALGMLLRSRRTQARETAQSLGPRVALGTAAGGSGLAGSDDKPTETMDPVAGEETETVAVVEEQPTEAVTPVTGSHTEAISLDKPQGDTFVAEGGLPLDDDVAGDPSHQPDPPHQPDEPDQPDRSAGEDPPRRGGRHTAPWARPGTDTPDQPGRSGEES